MSSHLFLLTSLSPPRPPPVAEMFKSRGASPQVSENAYPNFVSSPLEFIGVAVSDPFFQVLFTLIVASLVSLFTMALRKNDSKKVVKVVLVGCGMPKKSMGWYHLTQLLKMKDVEVLAVVEPFFCGICKDVPQVRFGRGERAFRSAKYLTASAKRKNVNAGIQGFPARL